MRKIFLSIIPRRPPLLNPLKIKKREFIFRNPHTCHRCRSHLTTSSSSSWYRNCITSPLFSLLNLSLPALSLELRGKGGLSELAGEPHFYVSMAQDLGSYLPSLVLGDQRTAGRDEMGGKVELGNQRWNGWWPIYFYWEGEEDKSLTLTCTSIRTVSAFLSFFTLLTTSPSTWLCRLQAPQPGAR